MSLTEGPEPGAVRCPRCGGPLASDQGWCLQCGTAARTLVASTPNWRAPVALVAAIVALSGAALAFAFVTLTRDDEPAATPTAGTAVATTPSAAPAPVAAPAGTAPPVATAPGGAPAPDPAATAPAAPVQTAPTP